MNFEESRLDKHIKRMYGKTIPQAMIEKALRNKDILVNGMRAKSSDKVTPSDEIYVHPSVERSFAALFCEEPKIVKIDHSKYIDQFKDMIIYEDKDLIIVNKPSGLAVQLGSKTNVALDLMAKEYHPEARLVHRIDKETSGITILSKNIETSRYMLHMFKTKQIHKKYAALVTGDLDINDDIITISKPLFRDKETVLVDFDNGKEAITEVQTIKSMGKNRILVTAIPLTGRTHQIRVHLASIDCPIVGDNKYKGLRAKHLYLHASEVRFLSPKGKKIFVTAPLPEYFK